MKRTILLMLVITMIGCSNSGRSLSEDPIRIHINQIGYLPDLDKVAVVSGPAQTFEVLRVADGQVVLADSLTEPRFWDASGESVRLADFSAVTLPGRYRLSVAGTPSAEFEIGSSVYSDIGTAGLKSYYFQRASTELLTEFAGRWARPAGHPDDEVRVHASAAGPERRTGDVISSPKGWYDAGDYNKYIPNSAITVATLLFLQEHYPDLASGIDAHIPESGNAMPDLLDETRWNLDWMLTMQDPADGGVYHKLTNLSFDGMELPHLTVEPRYVVMKTTQAALTFAGTMALAARIFAEQDPAFAARCLDAARAAWRWAEINPNVIYRQPADVQTGEYKEEMLEDERLWAATELSISTGGELEMPLIETATVPEWRDFAAMGLISQLNVDPNGPARTVLLRLADELVAIADEHPYGVSNHHFRWGSNSDFLNQALVLISAYRITGEQPYLNAAAADLDWVLGRNPHDLCFVSGFGAASPRNLHHRPSAGDGIDDPIPGFVIGGPNPENTYDCGAEAYASTLPALAYLDELCSYATNEVAINWNAPFVYVCFALMSRTGSL